MNPIGAINCQSCANDDINSCNTCLVTASNCTSCLGNKFYWLIYKYLWYLLKNYSFIYN